jgi:hypothetical protein
MPILVLTAKGELASKVKCKVFPFYSYKWLEGFQNDKIRRNATSFTSTG